jgi:hypothetical protein
LILGHCGVEVNERADSGAKQSIKEGRDWQILKTSGKMKVKRSYTVSVKTPKGTGESYFERYRRNGLS